ncbi:LPS-assembly protein LptD [Roseomonas genomospecies 6]|uniref:LPS-assembly protein LptD n=1 Tax=Roseomonas genomospecies 6 TaxID=214106 RepID=A0A9W7NNN2_9PROT|nr:LPS assembly protein LptD [Roseomonas genomospecies 6]KAA0683946.1 LPS-assembly protein LptD [Roseomonas genomospecies 6]
MSQLPSRHARRARASSPKTHRPQDRRSLVLRSGIVALMAACGVVLADLAGAQQPQPPATGPDQGGRLEVVVPTPAQPDGRPADGKPQEPPVLLGADAVTFDEANSLVTASGNVELSQGARTVHADTITYNQKTKVVIASGNVRLVEPSGDILFSNYAELTDDMRDAFVENVRMLMTDNSRMAGTEGERRGGRLIRLNRAVYSPCELCQTDPTRAPVWQIRAARVVQDNEDHEVRYRDAVMEMFGVPFFYTPYLSHPDPTVDRRSGFLTPSFRNNSELGFGVISHYYWDIAPDQDATIDVGGYTNQGLFLGGQYRKRFEKGRLQLDGSVAQGEIPNGTLKGADDKRWRGHAFASGLFDIDETWRWGFNLKRASDELYLRRYFNIRDEVLTSRAFVEGFNGRNYASVTAYSFQDLRWGNPVQEPYVLPEARYNALGEPGSLMGGRWSLDSSLLAIARPGSGGPDTQRLAVEPGWQRDIYSNMGFVTTLDASVLLAGYTAQRFDPIDPAGTGDDSVQRLRFFPQATATVRYPFVRYGESSFQTIEPIGQLSLSPRVDNDPAFPNEDSLDVEFDEVNLLMPNRFTGIDRLDGGARATYGLRSTYQGYKTGSASLFLGQSFRAADTQNFRGGSGLDKKTSDYVGRLDLRPADWLDVNYGFRIDHDTLKPRRHSVNASAGVPLLRLFSTYTYVDQTENPYVVERNEVEQASLTLASQFSTHWSASISHSQAFRPDAGPRSSAGVLRYQDECLIFEAIAQRDYTTIQNGEEEGNTIFFRFVFKNVGEFRTPGISAGFLGPSGASN